MRVLLLQLDGKLPNIALMRIAAHHRDHRGDEVTLRQVRRPDGVERNLFDNPDRVYASLIFQRTRPVAERLLKVYPDATVGGTGWDLQTTVEQYGVLTKRQDYSLYPNFHQSMGFTQRGCRLDCSFCVVRKKEGKVQEEQTIARLWRGEPWPRELLLLDNDFFGQPAWRERIREIREGGFKVSFNQGINARMLSEEAAEAIASVDYRDDSMKRKRIYTAWDSVADHETLFRGLNALVRHGVRPGHIMVYMLIGYDHATKTARPELHPDDFFRRHLLREFGCLPYPMPYVRSRELVGFQRWVIGFYDVPRKGRPAISWERWQQARYEPRNLGRPEGPSLFEAPKGGKDDCQSM